MHPDAIPHFAFFLFYIVAVIFGVSLAVAEAYQSIKEEKIRGVLASGSYICLAIVMLGLIYEHISSSF